MLVREIIAAALRKITVVASGETATVDEMGDALALLQAIVLEHPGMSTPRWSDLYAGSSSAITAKDGQRIFVGAWAPVITLPSSTSCWGRTRSTADLARVWIVGGDDEGLWLYSDEWRRADALTLDSENPFGRTADNGLSAQLAARMADEFGAQVGASTLAQAQRSEKSIRSRLYREPYCCPVSDYV